MTPNMNMKKSVSSGVAWVLVSGIMLACSSSSSSGTSSGTAAGGDGPVTDATLEAIGGAFCDRIKSCYGDFFVTTFIGDAATCKARLSLELKGSAKGQGVQVKDSQAAACKTAVDGASCDTLLDDGVKECDFRGTLADGAACANDSQCVSGACFVDPTTTCGKCGPRAAAGGDCTAAKCERGLACSGAKKCVKLGADGATCDPTSAPCELGLTCIAGKCGKALAAGVACKNGMNETPCDGFTGLFCKPPKATVADGTCTPFTPATVNELCGVTLQPTVDFSFCVNSECIGATSTTRGKCTAFLADGAACDATKQPDCEFPAKCRAGKCAVLDPTVCK
jgi:hypothetical protein